VVAIALDGVVRLEEANVPMSLDMPENQAIKYEWFGLQVSTEIKYSDNCKAIAKLFRRLEQKGLDKVLLLKGYGLSLYYPAAQHRDSGDIDIFSFEGKSEEVDRALTRKSEEEPERSSSRERHSHTSVCGVEVENHYCLCDIFSNPKRDSVVEAGLIEEAKENSRRVGLDDAHLFLPSATFNAVFLIWHLASHLTIERISLKQLCDWYCFLKVEGRNVDWEKVGLLLKKGRKKRLADTVNGLMIRYFGLDSSLIPAFGRRPEDEVRLMEFVFDDTPLKTKGPEAVLKYLRRSWNFRVAHESGWLGPLLEAASRHYMK
ncbi:MAG: nucleotidyltransferase family protein, partial [Bacteroidales bacterium]|nr:nucleotidyltransferase family protein [Candidatus Cacconaster merdequi]